MVLRIIKHALWLTLSNYLIKGSDLALEVSVEDSGGKNKDEGTTYWSLKKSVEDPYYDLPQDSSPDDPDNNTTPDKSTYTADVTLENAWLKIQDNDLSAYCDRPLCVIFKKPVYRFWRPPDGMKSRFLRLRERYFHRVSADLTKL